MLCAHALTQTPVCVLAAWRSRIQGMVERPISDWMVGDLGWSTRVRVLLLGTLGTGLMLGIIVLTFVLMHESAAKSDELARMQAATIDVDELSQLAVDLETGQRGFLLTAQESYLEPYERARRELPRVLTRIESRLPNDPAATAKFAQIREQLATKQQDIEMSIQLLRNEGLPRALVFFRTNFGQAIMDDIRVLKRSLAQTLRDHEGRLNDQISELRFQRELSIASLALLGIIAAIAAFVVLMRYVRALETERSARQDAEQSARESREKSNFLANMSHEIRTPMNAIFGFTELLGDLVKGEREQYYVRAISQSGKSLLALINDILDMSKIEAGKLDLHLQATDLRDLYAGVATVFSQMAMEKGIKLQTRVAADMPAALLLDPLRVRQLLFNLVGNAIKYTDHGVVKLVARVGPSALGADARALILEVGDTGVGIPEGQLQSIFEPFTQALRDGQPPRAGTGLGLSIVKRLLELMNGEIEVESTIGRGSTFRVVMSDVGVVAPEAARGPARECRLDDIAPLRIVAVDDVELNRELIEGLFANTHHQVLTAEDGASGVELVRRERPDFVLMDVRMPGMDGIEALRLIRAQPKLSKIKVIAVTASSLLGEQGLRQLFDGYVRKPISREALYDVLSNADASKANVGAMVDIRLTADQLTHEARDFLQAWLPQVQRGTIAAAGTLSTDEVQALIHTLAKLPPEPPFPVIIDLRQRMAEAAAVFDVNALEAILLELSAVTDEWSQTVS